MKSLRAVALALGIVVLGCETGDPRGGVANAYLATITEVENSCGSGPLVGAQLVVGVDANFTETVMDFTIGDGLPNPLVIPEIPVDADGDFAVTLPWDHEGSSENAEATMDFFGNITPANLLATYSLWLRYHEDDWGSYYLICYITVTVRGERCDNNCR